MFLILQEYMYYKYNWRHLQYIIYINDDHIRIDTLHGI